MKNWIRTHSLLAGLVAGIVGALIALPIGLGIWHAWVDHREYHQDHEALKQIVAYLNQQIAKSGGAK